MVENRPEEFERLASESRLMLQDLELTPEEDSVSVMKE